MSEKRRKGGEPGIPVVHSDLAGDLERIHGYDSTLDMGVEGEGRPDWPREQGRYAAEGEIGKGGMGTVYRVHDADLRRTLAMKVLNASQDLDSETGKSKVDLNVLRRFLEEAQVTGQLDHPAIISMHELGVDPAGRVYFTMPLVRGMDFSKIIDLAYERSDGWDRNRAVSCMIRVAEALAYAHSKGVIHRDLKPANIMAGRFGEVYVMDWGLAKVLGQEKDLALSSVVLTDRQTTDSDAFETLEGAVLGTPAYMAPEQARGEQDRIDGRTDIYALGAILYHIITGQAPYVPRGMDLPARTVLAWALEGPPKPIREIAPNASPELTAICEKAMSRKPVDRYLDCAEVVAELRRYLRGEPVHALPLSRAARTLRWCRKNPGALSLLAAVGLVGLLSLWALSFLNAQIVRETALEGAATKARILEEVNTLYVKEVSDRAGGGIVLTHDYDEPGHEGELPLPATFLTLLGDRVSSADAGVEVRHYSDEPFKYRDPAPLDPFEREALDHLVRNKDEPYFRFDEVDGASVLRFATARVMVEGCLACHNTDPNSPRHDWKVGDVRGVLSIIQPLGNDIASTQRVMRGLFLGVGAAIAGALALFAAYVVRMRRAARRGS